MSLSLAEKIKIDSVLCQWAIMSKQFKLTGRLFGHIGHIPSHAYTLSYCARKRRCRHLSFLEEYLSFFLCVRCQVVRYIQKVVLILVLTTNFSEMSAESAESENSHCIHALLHFFPFFPDRYN